jgi:hypothetical protein
MNINDVPQEYVVNIPSNIDLDNLLLRYPSDVKNAKDYLLYLLSIITRNGEYTQLHSLHKLQKIVDNYRPLLNWLIERRIVEYNRYVVGERARGFRFTRAYRGELKQEFIHRKTLIRKILLSQLADAVDNDPPSQDLHPTTPHVELNTNQYPYMYGLAGGDLPPFKFLSSKVIASTLGLRPIKMTRALRELGLLPATKDFLNLHPYSRKWFAYTVIDTPGGFQPILMIKRDAVNLILRLALEFPELFPRKS